ncbi:fatty acyl-AMP ligase [Pelatocladus sp. BLCC-F211]|uniref:fatty acyl-AMP ligase n=1 Tax=Pelatocladus sp. BLCC-F211 TaxID=3342752 RepID=UPI0035B79526
MNEKSFSTLVSVLRHRNLNCANQVAYTFLQDGVREAERLTYQQLDRQARAIAAYLQSFRSIGERALLLYRPGLEFVAAFFGCLYAGVIAVPAYPPQPNRSISRLQAIVADAQATFALTTTSVLTSLKKESFLEPDLNKLNWFATDQIDTDLANSWQEPVISSDTLAFLQYTSGSTGTPKGVMVSHGNLLRNCLDLDLGWQHTADSSILTWLPTFHDMGLIYGVIEPLYKQSHCYMMPPMSFLKKPVRWLEAISKYKVTHSGAPNFAYELCLRKITPEQRANLNLSSWRMALNGAEPIRASVLKRFAETFKSCGFNLTAFCPGYGLAEATLKVAAVRQQDTPIFYSVQTDALLQNQVNKVNLHEQKAQILVGCGRSEIDTKIVIVHPETLTKCTSVEVGEIWVSGSSVAQGYWEKPQETKQTFQAYLAETGEGPFLRTGDLGFLKDGELFVTGRLKDVVIIWGRNYYPQDIELTVEKSHLALRPGCGVAFAIEIENQEKLVVVQEIERSYLQNLDMDEVVGNIRQAVMAQYDLPIYAVVLVKPGNVPKTSSGKLQRRECRAKFLNGNLELVNPMNKNQKFSNKAVHQNVGITQS